MNKFFTCMLPFMLPAMICLLNSTTRFWTRSRIRWFGSSSPSIYNKQCVVLLSLAQTKTRKTFKYHVNLLTSVFEFKSDLKCWQFKRKSHDGHSKIQERPIRRKQQQQFPSNISTMVWRTHLKIISTVNFIQYYIWISKIH